MSGFIQLITSGYDNILFNKDADIDFFKIIYRRHTNFFINTMLLYNDNIKNDEETMINFIIPNDGDLLSETFIKLESEENYYELFNFSSELGNYKNTLNTDILNFYDNYYIKIQDYSKNDIKNIFIMKINISDYLTIEDTNIKNINKYENYIELILKTKSLILETNDIFYNLDLSYNYYSFITDIIPENILNTNYLDILFENINYGSLQYIRIDIPLLELSLKIIATTTFYKLFFDLFIKSQNANNNDRMQINKYDLYFYTTNSTVINELENLIVNIMGDIIYYEHYKNKYDNPNKYSLTKEETINSKFLKYNNTYNYNIIDLEYSKIIIYNFDNLNNNDFNSSIIKNQNTIINTSNLNDTYLCLNTFLRLYVYIYADNSVNINDYLNNISSIKNSNTTNLSYLYKKYKNINNFYEKIIKILINDNVYLSNRDTWRSIIYQTISQEENLNTFINKKISEYQNIINNKYILENIINSLNVSTMAINNISTIYLNTLLLLNNLDFTTNNNNKLYFEKLYGYTYNNNIFDINIKSDISTSLELFLINMKDKYDIFYYYQYGYSYFYLVSSSIKCIQNIYNKKSISIYTNDGQNTKLINNFEFSIFPLSSNLFISNKYTLFNIDYSDYSYKINTIIYEIYKNKNILYSQILNINLLTKEQFIDKNKIIISKVLSPIIEYYQSSNTIPNFLPIDNLNIITSYIKIDNSCYFIYGIDYNKIILENIFNTINTELFNGTFKNINIYKFYFTVGSPLYRLFYLFNFLCTMTEDKELLNIMPFDLITLRNLLLYYILSYFNLNTNDITHTFSNLNYIDNFLCYDKININNNTIYDEINIYSSFYFIKSNDNELDVDYKYNFDDKFTIDFIRYISNYQYYFKDIESINELILVVLGKKNSVYNELVYLLNNIILNPIEYINITNLKYNKDVFYNNKIYIIEYLSIYSIGVFFDNINLLNINTINSIYKFNSLLNSEVNEIFTILPFNIKKNNNFILVNNLIQPLDYFITLFYNLNNSTYLYANIYYNNLLLGYKKYLKDNISYLEQYIITYDRFVDCQNIIIKYYNLYNSKNNTDITSYNTKYIVYVYNIILKNIYNYYEIFLYSDIMFFIENFYNKTTTFEDYIFKKYGKNIYINLIYEIIDIINNENNINLNFSYISINKKDNENKSNYIMFYNQLNSSLVDVKNQYDILIYPSINNNVLDKSSSITILNNNSITYNYNEYKKLIYRETLKILKQIYIQNYDTYIQNSKNYKNKYEKNIIKQLLLIINNFSNDIGNNCYLKTIYYKNYLLNSSDDLIKYSTDYLNFQILDSFNVETELNRFLYFHTTRYAVELNGDDEILYLKSKSLYDIVKMYVNPICKNYLKNLNITQNNKAYELLNFNLYNDKLTSLQNSIFVDLLVSVEDYYSEYLLFYNKCLDSDNKIFNSLIINYNINAAEYFLDILNIEELKEYINDYILLNKNFSPFHLYNDILELKNTNNNIGVQYIIKNNDIVKKIVIYLFIMFLIYNKLPEYIIKYLDLKEEEYLEYIFPLQKVNFKIKNALNNNVKYDLNKFIYTYYRKKLNLDVPSEYKNNYYNEKIIFIIENNLKYINLVNNYYDFCKNYINSYSLVIGYKNYNINTLTTLTTSNENFTYSDIIENINLVYNLDQDSNNMMKYDLTNYTLITNNLYYENNIYNINNFLENTNLSVSEYLQNMKNYHYKTDIGNINVFLTLTNYLLNYYNINYSKKYDDNNNVISNIISETNYINEFLEILKGNTSNYTIYNDLIVDSTNSIMLSRSLTLKKLSVMVTKYDYYGLSLITPIDYNNDTIFTNLKQTYETKIDIFKKYFNIEYNFYQYNQNNKGIYTRKLDYYKKMLLNNLTIINVKKYNSKIYQKLFVDIFYTNIAQTYYFNTLSYIDVYKNILKTYMKYNFLFRNNTNLDMYQNIQIQSAITKKGTLLTNSENKSLIYINKFITELYYYELFNEDIYNVVKNNCKYDFINFFNTLENSYNYYFEYNKYGYNYINKIKLSSEYLKNKKCNNVYLKEIIDDNYINKIYNKLVNKKNIWDYLNNMYNKYLKDSPQIYDYYKFIQTINIYEFLDSFTNAVKNIIEYDITFSINYQLEYVYNTYFLNKTFYYKTYIQNSVQYSSYVLNIKEFEYYIYKYITDIINEDNKLIINNTFFGITEISYDNILMNENIDIKIELINNYFIKSNNIKTNYDYINNKNEYLVILYKLKILLNMTINQQDYLINMGKLLNMCNKYVVEGIEVDCINLENDISLYFDFLDYNIIPDNKIPNYFKNVMNISVEKIYVNNIENSNNDYIDTNVYNVYNDLVNNTVDYSEENITLNTLPNMLIKILSNNTTNLINYDNPSIIEIFVKIILEEINIRLKKLEPFLGGFIEISSNYKITINQMYEIYKDEIIQINGNYGNCFSLIYANYDNFSINTINNEVLIVLFYYIAMISYLFNYGQEFVINLPKIIKYLVNIINSKLIINDNLFFDKLNPLLKNQVNNYNFIKGCYLFFYELLFNEGIINNEIFNRKECEFMNSSYSNSNGFIKNENIYITEKTINNYIINSKINVWVFMTPMIYGTNNNVIINYMKSISIDNYNITNIPEIYVSYLSNIVKIINEWGILQIFDKLSLFIGQQLIDHFKVDNYKIFYEIMTDSNKIKTIRQMYGMDQDNLTNTLVPYIKKLNNRNYYIPVYFFFKDRMNALPIIACMYPTIILQLITNKNSLISNFYTNNVLYDSKIKFKTALSSDFILLEREERNKISKSINDNLIERHNNYSINLSLSDFSVLNSIIIMDYEFELNNNNKELFWTLDFYINDYELKDLNTKNDILLSTIFSIDGIKIDGINASSAFTVANSKNGLNNNSNLSSISQLYGYINAYKYNTRSNPNLSYYSYSFAFKPETLQPTGAYNMSNTSKFWISLVLDYSKLLKYIGGYNNLKQLSIKMNLLTYEYNILRFQSGIAGLLYQQ